MIKTQPGPGTLTLEQSVKEAESSPQMLPGLGWLQKWSLSGSTEDSTLGHVSSPPSVKQPSEEPTHSHVTGQLASHILANWSCLQQQVLHISPSSLF